MGKINCCPAGHLTRCTPASSVTKLLQTIGFDLGVVAGSETCHKKCLCYGDLSFSQIQISKCSVTHCYLYDPFQGEKYFLGSVDILLHCMFGSIHRQANSC